MSGGTLELPELVESTTREHKGIVVSELVYRDGDRFRPVWVRESIDRMEVDGFANPCFHAPHPDPEFAYPARRRVAEAFDRYRASPRTIGQMAEAAP